MDGAPGGVAVGIFWALELVFFAVASELGLVAVVSGSSSLLVSSSFFLLAWPAPSFFTSTPLPSPCAACPAGVVAGLDRRGSSSSGYLCRPHMDPCLLVTIGSGSLRVRLAFTPAYPPPASRNRCSTPGVWSGCVTSSCLAGPCWFWMSLLRV